MKKCRLLACLILLSGIAVSGSASADPRHGGGHGHGHGGSSFGFYLGLPFPNDPFYYPYRSYPYPYYSYPPVVTVPVPSQPPVYIEQEDVQPDVQEVPAEDGGYFWYHCDKPEGYYPYVKKCPGGWEKVAPTPPPQ